MRKVRADKYGYTRGQECHAKGSRPGEKIQGFMYRGTRNE